MKGEVHIYHMRYGSMICYKRLQSYSTGLYWVLLGFTDMPLHFGMSLCNPLKDNKLPYTRWKGTCIAFIWGRVAWSAPRGCRETSSVSLKMAQASYIWSYCIMSVASSIYSFPERPASAGSRNLNRRWSYLLYPGIMTTAHEDLTISKTKNPSTSFINHDLQRFIVVSYRARLNRCSAFLV